MQRRGISKAFAAMSLVGGAVTASTYLADNRVTTQAIRYAGTTAVLVLLARRRSRTAPHWNILRPRGPEWIWLGAAGTLGLTIYNLALVEALQHADAALVASIVAGVPLVLALVAPRVSGGRASRRTVGGAAVIVTGSFLVFGAGRSDLLGLGLAATALACECCFTLLSVPVLERLGPVSIATHTAWIAGAQLTVLAAITSGGSVGSGWTAATIAATGYLIAASAAAFVLWFDAVASVGSALAGLAAGAIPIVGLLTGVLLGTSRATAAGVVGVAIVTTGVLVALGPTRQRTATPIP